ncbi:MAG: TraB/GumN family protein [Flavisolibacter sp.]
MICADDIELSDSLKQAIKTVDNVYLELNMNNLFEMMGAMTHMTMRNDTTLADLMTPVQYKQVKAYFKNHSSLLPFSIIETYKPLIAASTLMEQSFSCDHVVSIEEMIMQEAKIAKKEIKGLETMNFQLSIFDSIPYREQANQLLEMVEDSSKNKEGQQMIGLTNAYRNQQLDSLEKLTKGDLGMKEYSNLLLYNRNRTWVKKMTDLMVTHALVVAVGAGHLPGEKGLINLLKKAGYRVEPVQNRMIKRKTKEI